MVATARRQTRVVTKRDAVLTDPPTRCTCGRCFTGVMYQGDDRKFRCAPCAIAGDKTLRTKKYVKPPQQSVYQKVEG